MPGATTVCRLANYRNDHGYGHAMRLVDVDRCSANFSHFHLRWVMPFWGEERRACEYANRLVSYDVCDKEKQKHEHNGDVKLRRIGREQILSRAVSAIAFPFLLAMVGSLTTVLFFVGHGDDLASLGRGETYPSVVWFFRGQKLVANVAASNWFKLWCV